jgi:hypothetical protein
MVSCQEPSPLKGSKHSLQRHPHDAALVNAHSFVSMGVEARCCPCHSTAHCWHMKRRPALCHCCPHCGRCHCNPRCCLRHCCCLHCRPLPLPLPSPLPSLMPIAIAICHCCHSCCCPLLPPSPLRCRQPLPSLSPSPSVISISITVDHYSCHLHWPSPLPLPSAIAKSCCLVAVRIVFKQFKQLMLTLFCFVWTVVGALIKAR